MQVSATTHTLLVWRHTPFSRLRAPLLPCRTELQLPSPCLSQAHANNSSRGYWDKWVVCIVERSAVKLPHIVVKLSARCVRCASAHAHARSASRARSALLHSSGRGSGQFMIIRARCPCAYSMCTWAEARAVRCCRHPSGRYTKESRLYDQTTTPRSAVAEAFERPT